MRQFYFINHRVVLFHFPYIPHDCKVRNIPGDRLLESSPPQQECARLLTQGTLRQHPVLVILCRRESRDQEHEMSIYYGSFLKKEFLHLIVCQKNFKLLNKQVLSERKSYTLEA